MIYQVQQFMSRCHRKLNRNGILVEVIVEVGLSAGFPQSQYFNFFFSYLHRPQIYRFRKPVYTVASFIIRNDSNGSTQIYFPLRLARELIFRIPPSIPRMILEHMPALIIGFWNSRPIFPTRHEDDIVVNSSPSGAGRVFSRHHDIFQVLAIRAENHDSMGCEDSNPEISLRTINIST
jgi:hypothetical protein